MNLWDDQRARRIGDIIMIKLDERTVSQKSSKSSFKKNDANDLSVSSLLGVTPELKLPGAFNADTPLGLGVSSKNDRSFAGESGADQSNRLLGDISVTVVNVLPGGVLAVRGEKWITLTQGEEFIRIEGLIRQSDIAPDNTVESTRIADARITYSGTGELADANKRGWLTKVFSGPWWPF
jgi:flagellar L-ring protein precursor FlgH